MRSEHSDDEVLAAGAAALADGVEESLAGWVERGVGAVIGAYTGVEPSVEVRSAAHAAGLAAVADIVPRLRDLLERDIDDQRTNPLSILRHAVAYPTAVLRSAGVPPVVRDEVAEAQFPDDDYDLTPASFADIDPGLHEPGLMWGAAKAHVHLRRHRTAGGDAP